MTDTTACGLDVESRAIPMWESFVYGEKTWRRRKDSVDAQKQRKKMKKEVTMNALYSVDINNHKQRCQDFTRCLKYVSVEKSQAPTWTVYHTN